MAPSMRTASPHFIDHCYRDAGFARGDVDSGAVILTGEAIKRRNARAIDELFAGEAGKFVCATAGHILECRLAAHGSGAVRLSRERAQCVLHVDIGGGTTKLALIDRGTVLSSAAFALGGRLIASDAAGQWTRARGFRASRGGGARLRHRSASTGKGGERAPRWRAGWRRSWRITFSARRWTGSARR